MTSHNTDAMINIEGQEPTTKGGEHLEKEKNYQEPHCWQYEIRLRNREDDLREAGLTEEDVKDLRVEDFTFREVVNKEEARDFILRHEWLGTISQYTTHWFGCYYKERLAGVQLFNMPNAFSKALGENTPKLERLISRGACISWSPKNLASAFLMWCIDWMVKNTTYRLFTAYSDPEAKELGTIYQACNFYYLGQTFGASRRYINPYTGRVVSDRFFRTRSAYRKYAKDMGIEWVKGWNGPQKMNWENIPDDIETRLRERSKEMQKNATIVESTPKHKYAYVKGANKSETKKLRQIFEKRNRTYPYPKNRGE